MKRDLYKSDINIILYIIYSKNSTKHSFDLYKKKSTNHGQWFVQSQEHLHLEYRIEHYFIELTEDPKHMKVSDNANMVLFFKKV